MRCADLSQLISTYVDGEAAPEETHALEAHVAGCPRCQGILRRAQQTRRLLNLVGDDSWLPPDLRFRVRYGSSQEVRSRSRRGLLAGALGSLAALVLAVALLGSHLTAPHAVMRAAPATPAVTAIRSPVARRIQPPLARAAHPMVAQAVQPPLAAALARCGALPPYRLAQCLGVAPEMLPVVLVEARSMAQSLSVQDGPRCSRQVAVATACWSGAKGGGAEAVFHNRAGLQPV